MRHGDWKIVMECLDKIAENLGHTIHDSRCGNSWDVGQAVCAEAYGPNWDDDPVFNEWNQKDEDEPPEPDYFHCAVKMANGYIPEWTRREREAEQCQNTTG